MKLLTTWTGVLIIALLAIAMAAVSVIQYAHHQTPTAVASVIGLLFAQVRIRSLGLGRQFSFYRFIEARAPRLDVAEQWERRFGGT